MVGTKPFSNGARVAIVVQAAPLHGQTWTLPESTLYVDSDGCSEHSVGLEYGPAIMLAKSIWYAPTKTIGWSSLPLV